MGTVPGSKYGYTGKIRPSSTPNLANIQVFRINKDRQGKTDQQMLPIHSHDKEAKKERILAQMRSGRRF